MTARRASRHTMPGFVEPQLARLLDRPPSGDGWGHEMKLDGYRIQARLDGGKVALLTRSGLDWTAKFPETAAAFRPFAKQATYIDGELCALGADGVPSFSALQSAIAEKRTGALVYFAFDLIFLGADDLRPSPLVERKEQLQQLLNRLATDRVRYVEHVVWHGAAFLEAACKLHLEGVVSKRLTAPYKPGEAGRGTWTKAKCLNSAEFVIVGFSDPEGARPYLGSLLLGYHDEAGKLRYAGRAGSGMSMAELERVYRKLKPLIVETTPLAEKPPKGSHFGRPLNLSRVHWVKPVLVAQVSFLTWTADGLLRQVTYQGLREDKPASSIVRERPA